VSRQDSQGFWNKKYQPIGWLFFISKPEGLDLYRPDVDALSLLYFLFL